MKIEFKEKEHKYFKGTTEYSSVSKVISTVEPPFPAEVIARNIAKSQGVTKEEILEEWRQKRDSSTEIGNDVHRAMDQFSRNGICNDLYWNDTAKDIEKKLFSKYDVVDSEVVLHSDKFEIAGTADRLCYRNKHIIDIRDFKTNEVKGIVYADKYNKFMKGPLSHLENTNYNKYAIQLSCYGYLVEEELGYKIGNLALVFIPPTNPMDWQYIPVPYMRKEVEDLFIQHRLNNAF